MRDSGRGWEFSIEGNPVVTAVFATPGEPGVIASSERTRRHLRHAGRHLDRCEAVVLGEDFCTSPELTGCRLVTP